MHPTTIPYIFCGLICLAPIAIAVGTFFGLMEFTNKIPSRDVTKYLDSEGREHFVTDWAMLPREVRKARSKNQEQEEEV